MDSMRVMAYNRRTAIDSNERTQRQMGIGDMLTKTTVASDVTGKLRPCHPITNGTLHSTQMRSHIAIEFSQLTTTSSTTAPRRFIVFTKSTTSARLRLYVPNLSTRSARNAGKQV
jgi:hypothetical protein